MIVVPVMPNVMMNAGHVPIREYTVPIASPITAKKADSAASIPNMMRL